jgi:hypothetical protein
LGSSLKRLEGSQRADAGVDSTSGMSIPGRKDTDATVHSTARAADFCLS